MTMAKLSFPIQDDSREGPHPHGLPSVASSGWRFIWWIGVLFLLIGLTDIVLFFIPSNFGSPEWEFGSSVALLNGLTVPTLGLLLMVAGATSSGWAGFRWPGVIILATGLVAIVLIGLLFMTTIPIALRSTQDPNMAIGLQKATAKTLVQLVAYATAYLAALVYLARWGRSRSNAAPLR
jgi:hypothetical protein